MIYNDQEHFSEKRVCKKQERCMVIFVLGGSDSQQTTLFGKSSHNLNPIKDFPVPVGCTIAALPVSFSI